MKIIEIHKSYHPVALFGRPAPVRNEAPLLKKKRESLGKTIEEIAVCAGVPVSIVREMEYRKNT
jgi:hypothetical protein